METDVIIAFAAAFVLGIPCAILGRRKKTKTGKIIESASKEGRTVTARLVKEKYYVLSDSSPYRQRNPRYRYRVDAKYEYTVDGRTYRMKRRYYGEELSAPKELTVYYAKGRPGKSYVNAMDKKGIGYTLYMLFPVVIFLVVYLMLYLCHMRME